MSISLFLYSPSEVEKKKQPSYNWITVQKYGYLCNSTRVVHMWLGPTGPLCVCVSYEVKKIDMYQADHTQCQVGHIWPAGCLVVLWNCPIIT